MLLPTRRPGDRPHGAPRPRSRAHGTPRRHNAVAVAALAAPSGAPLRPLELLLLHHGRIPQAAPYVACLVYVPAILFNITIVVLIKYYLRF